MLSSGEKQEDELEGMTKLEAEAMKKKKKDLLGAFNELNNNGQIDEDSIQNIAI